MRHQGIKAKRGGDELHAKAHGQPESRQPVARWGRKVCNAAYLLETGKCDAGSSGRCRRDVTFFGVSAGGCEGR